MSALPYVGKTQTATRDLVTYGYVQSLFALNMTQSQVDTQVNNALAGSVTKAYVDTQDALNANKAYVDAGDATRLKLAQIGVANGAVGLNASGRIDANRVSVASTQRYPSAFWSPSAYNASAVNVTTTETQVYTCAVADPGYTYKLFVTGLQDLITSVDGEYGIMRVRVGSTTGQVIAGAYGLAETYSTGALQTYNTAGSFTYNVPSYAGSADVIALGSGGGSQDGYVFFGASFNGRGGGAGSYATAQLTKTAGTLPTTLSVTVGAGGARQLAGNASTVSGTGFTTVSGAGGIAGPTNGNTDSIGYGPGNQIYQGNTYTGGANQTTVGQVGNAPGGGASGGTPPGGGPGVAGAPGAVWIFVRPVAASPSGTAYITPTPLNAQTALTGAKTLYVTLTRVGTTSTQQATTVTPKLFVMAIPA